MKQAVVLGNSSMTLLDLKEGKALEKAAIPHNIMEGAAISPNGKLACISDGMKIHVIEIVSGKTLAMLKESDVQWCAVFTTNSKYLLSGSSGKVNLWNIENSQKIYEFDTAGEHSVQIIAVSPDGYHFATGPALVSKDLQVFRLPSEATKP